MQLCLKCVLLVLSSQHQAEPVLLDMRRFVATDQEFSSSGSILQYVVKGLVQAMRQPAAQCAACPQTASSSSSPVASDRSNAPEHENPKQQIPEAGHETQLLAATALVQLAAFSDQHHLPNQNYERNRGPFREIMQNIGLQAHLLWMSQLNWEGPSQASLDAIVSYGTMILSSSGQELPVELLTGVLEYTTTKLTCEHCSPKTLQLLCFALWTMCQNSHNLKKLRFGNDLTNNSTHCGLDCCIQVLHHLFVLFSEWEAKGQLDATKVKEAAKTVEAAVLLLWRLLEDFMRDLQPACDSNCKSLFISSPTTWWELRFNNEPCGG